MDKQQRGYIGSTWPFLTPFAGGLKRSFYHVSTFHCMLRQLIAIMKTLRQMDGQGDRVGWIPAPIKFLAISCFFTLSSPSISMLLASDSSRKILQFSAKPHKIKRFVFLMGDFSYENTCLQELLPLNASYKALNCPLHLKHTRGNYPLRC